MRTEPGAAATERGGFALVMVVMLLFVIAVAGATGYELVHAENELTMGVEAQEEAVAAARAGMERYVGEHLGVPGASTTYAVGVGSATVTQKKVLSIDSITDLYMLESVGTISDSRYPNSPATRTVRQYAKLHLMPVYPYAALMSVGTTMTLPASDSVLGNHNTVDSNCTSGSSGWTAHGPNDINSGTVSVTNASTGGTVNGKTTARKILGSAAAVQDTAKVHWSALKDSQLSVGTLDSSSLPSQATFDALPSDSFPIVRVNGNLALSGFGSSRSGKGVLIVTGTITQSGFLNTFAWDGIVLAGGGGTFGGTFNSFTVDGMVVLGLDGAVSQTFNTHVRIWNCTYNIQRADRSLAYFELLDGSRWEF